MEPSLYLQPFSRYSAPRSRARAHAHTETQTHTTSDFIFCHNAVYCSNIKDTVVYNKAILLAFGRCTVAALQSLTIAGSAKASNSMRWNDFYYNVVIMHASFRNNENTSALEMTMFSEMEDTMGGIGCQCCLKVAGDLWLHIFSYPHSTPSFPLP